MKTFLLIVMVCYGHTNATCQLEEDSRWETMQLCRAEMASVHAVPQFLMGDRITRKHRKGTAFCIDADVFSVL